MTSDAIDTKEVAPLPQRADDAHKGDVGRLVILGGCDDEVMMAGAPALVAQAALRSGVGLVQMLVPETIRGPAISIAPCATARTLPIEALAIVQALSDFRADVVAIGPGLGNSIDGKTIVEVLQEFKGPVVVDADGLNRIAETPSFDVENPNRIVLTPHAGEAKRLLQSRNRTLDDDKIPAGRRAGALAMVDEFKCNVVLKGPGTVVTDGRRVYTNGTGNSGMATGGAGDVLTGVIAALIGQKMEPLEAAILGVYIHGLAADIAAAEGGRMSLTALDLIDYLPEAFIDYDLAAEG